MGHLARMQTLPTYLPTYLPYNNSQVHYLAQVRDCVTVLRLIIFCENRNFLWKQKQNNQSNTHKETKQERCLCYTAQVSGERKSHLEYALFSDNVGQKNFFGRSQPVELASGLIWFVLFGIPKENSDSDLIF